MISWPKGERTFPPRPGTQPHWPGRCPRSGQSGAWAAVAPSTAVDYRESAASKVSASPPSVRPPLPVGLAQDIGHRRGESLPPLRVFELRGTGDRDLLEGVFGIWLQLGRSARAFSTRRGPFTPASASSSSAWIFSGPRRPASQIECVEEGS